METPKSILIVGAGGFIGGFIARRALELGYRTTVGVRPSTSRRYLQDPRLSFIEFDYDDPRQVAVALSDGLPPQGAFTNIIWNLGATKVAHAADFDRINYGYLRTFVKALEALKATPRRFLFMSSLSALGPGDELGYTPLDNNTMPRPNTRYGASKIKAETFLESQTWLPWVVFRPTGVYGPHEKDYLMMIQSIHRHWDFSVGMRPQMLTFIYVDDLVEAMFQALGAPADKVVHKKYIIAEGRAYTQAEFREIVARRLGMKWVIPVRLPLGAVRLVSAVAEKIAAAKGRTSTLNRDKYKIMAQRNWRADISEAQADFGFNPRHSLEQGIDLTVKAYLEGLAHRRLAHKKRLGLQ